MYVKFQDRRLAAIKEMARVLVKSGRALIYVWAKNQAVEKKSSYLRQNKKNNRPESPNEKTEMVETNDSAMANNGLPIHTNRTQFAHQDILVPWKLKKANETANTDKSSAASETFLRFYHVFEEHELERMCADLSDIKVIKSYYDQGNWCVIFEKIA